MIQIDSPATVSGFMQRMGRTGRRPGSERNCLFLATSDQALLLAAGLVSLRESGFVEPVAPPPQPRHLLVQQLMALALQEAGIGRSDWWSWLENVRGFADLPTGEPGELLEWLLGQEILWEEQGIVWLGRDGESRFGYRNFMELFTVFTSPPQFNVHHGQQELGTIDELTFLTPQGESPRVILLAGHAWRVKNVDWNRKLAWVEPSREKGLSRWQGTGRTLGFQVCQAVKRLLSEEEVSRHWSARAQERIDGLRVEHHWVNRSKTSLQVSREGKIEWWTFAGDRANNTLAHQLSRRSGSDWRSDSRRVFSESPVVTQTVVEAIGELAARDPLGFEPAVARESIRGLKFADCLPESLALETLRARMRDPEPVRCVLAQPFVIAG